MEDGFQFIDFGSGGGQSFEFASSCLPGKGLAIDKSKTMVENLKNKGFHSKVADVVDFNHRNISIGSFAINLLQEMEGRKYFQKALINIIRSSTEFTVIQHGFYDHDNELALDGLRVPENFSKTITFKPTASDYIDFLLTHRQALSLSGMAICVSGEIAAEAMTLFSGMSTPRKVAKTTRVIFGRKNVERFRRALYRAKAGKSLFLWEKE